MPRDRERDGLRSSCRKGRWGEVANRTHQWNHEAQRGGSNSCARKAWHRSPEGSSWLRAVTFQLEKGRTSNPALSQADASQGSCVDVVRALQRRHRVPHFSTLQKDESYTRLRRDCTPLPSHISPRWSPTPAKLLLPTGSTSRHGSIVSDWQ